jgi:hypothetical protein
MSFRDLAAVIGACMKLAIISFILSPKQWFNKEPKHTEEF